MKKSLLLISSGWAVRNYIRSGFAAQLQEDTDVHILLPQADATFVGELAGNKFHVRHFAPVSIPRPLSLLNTVLVNAHNRRLGYWHSTMWRWSRSLHRKLKWPYLESLRALSVAVQPDMIFDVLKRMHDRWVKRMPVADEYERMLRELKPDVVFCSNPFSWSEIPVVVAANRLGIPTVGSVISWDNLSYMGFLPTQFSRYVVWSESMKSELLRACPEIAESAVSITGTPQFDFHFHDDLVWDRSRFFDHIGGDPNRPLLTYASATPLDNPQEADVVEYVWNTIRKEVPGNPQLLLRVHPHDDSNRFEAMLARNPDILVSRPWASDPNRFWWFTPSRAEIGFLSNTIRHSEMIVNVFSSVVLDSAILDTPNVCIGFPLGHATLASDYIVYAMRQGHLKYLTQTGGARVAFDQAELVSYIEEGLTNPGIGRAGRREMVRMICGPADGHATDRLLGELLELCSISPRRHAALA